MEQLKKNGLQMDDNVTYMSIETALQNYTITAKSTALTLLTDIPDMVRYFFACKKLEGIANSSLKNYGYTLRHFSDCVNKPVAAITINDIRNYLYNLSKRGIKESTIESKIYCLKSFFGWLSGEGYITGNPTFKIVVPKKPSTLREGLTVEELELARNACKIPRDRALLEVLLSTGCRVSEIVGLKLTDIKNNSIKVLGKGNKERIVFLNAKAMMYLKIYVKKRMDKSDYMFSALRRDVMTDLYNPIKVKAIEDAISNVGKRSELHLYPHIFRHTFATMALNNGAKLEEVQDMLGHSDPKTTRIYAKTSQDSLQTVHKKSAVA